MNIEQLRNFCILKKGVTESFPFDESTLVFKVSGKMFALISLKKWEEGNPSINLKCNPEKAIMLREEFESILAGYHMSKKHWNTILINKEVTDNMIFELIDHSYQLVVNGLTKKQKQQLNSI